MGSYLDIDDVAATSELAMQELAELRAEITRLRAELESDPGYVRVPVELTAETGAKAALIGEFTQVITTACPECCGDDDDDDRILCGTCDGDGEIELNVDISWSNIKEIYKSAIQHFYATKELPND